ncbi:MAG: NAD(P)/FAD-dependent oxidoreductase [Magnetococcales bacterium]|nr:NAD(P)/FAD-dependent oxidoreductase [Magnetococcales bacterium]
MSSSPTPHLLIIGNGMAGIRTVEELTALAPQAYQITVFGAEPHGCYNRILLSPLLAGEKSLPEIITHPASWYAERGIALHASNPITTIDRQARRVIDSQGGVHSYDKLLLATGSHPLVIPLPGHQLPGVVTFRNLADVEKMLTVAAPGKQAIVIGGGLLGLEAAMGLLQQGMQVTVVHLLDILMERQLDGVAASLLKSELEARGIRFHMPAQTEAILGASQVQGIRFKDGSVLPADLVVMAVGVRPNTDLAKAAGLSCERGILVDDQLQTSDPHILAVGECVQHRGTVYGLVAPLFEQGKVIARRLAGTDDAAAYRGSTTSTRLKVTGIELFSAGNFLGDAECDTILFQDPSRRIYKKLVIKNHIVQGAVLLGDTMDGAWYMELMRDGTDITPFRHHILFGRPHLGDAGHGPSSVADLPASYQVCGCNGVCKGSIEESIIQKELTTLEEVRAHTKASASCGSCTGMVEQILAHTLGGDYVPAPVKPLCRCTTLSSDQLRIAVRDQHLTSVATAMQQLAWQSQDGCPTCRQALNYYITVFWPAEHQESPLDRFVNERFHANIQRDGTYSVVPRLWGGTTTPAQLRAIADIAERFAVPEIKLTGGQRITLLGIKRETLPAIWAALGEHDLVSGHAYGKAVRTVKTCVGSRWCRFGVQDSEQMGVALEKQLWNSWTSHKYKLAVSGCPRNCAEATIKDFGVVAVESGWELHVGGNGGIKVRVTDLLCRVESMAEVSEYAAAFLQLYRREAVYLERTAPWVERVGIDWIRQQLVDQPAYRKQLHDAFVAAHQPLADPWMERVQGLAGTRDFLPLVSLPFPTLENVA